MLYNLIGNNQQTVTSSTKKIESRLKRATKSQPLTARLTKTNCDRQEQQKLRRCRRERQKLLATGTTEAILLQLRDRQKLVVTRTTNK